MFHDIFSKKIESQKQKIKIIADIHEKDSLLISQLLAQDKIEIEFKPLQVADYIINNIAIERKTLSDLKSSIINKRIMSQLIELKQFPKHFLLIEGPQESLYAPPLHENAIRGFLLSVILNHQVPIIFTKDAKDSANYLYLLSKKQNNSPPSLRQKIPLSEKDQLQFILEGFPNIGPVKAKALINKFKSLKNIISSPFQSLQEILGKNAEAFKSLIEKEFS